MDVKKDEDSPKKVKKVVEKQEEEALDETLMEQFDRRMEEISREIDELLRSKSQEEEEIPSSEEDSTTSSSSSAVTVIDRWASLAPETSKSESEVAKADMAEKKETAANK